MFAIPAKISSTALSYVVGTAAVGYNLVYLLVAGMFVYKVRKRSLPPSFGRFTLGRWAQPVGWAAAHLADLPGVHAHPAEHQPGRRLDHAGDDWRRRDLVRRLRAPGDRTRRSRTASRRASRTTRRRRRQPSASHERGPGDFPTGGHPDAACERARIECRAVRGRSGARRGAVRRGRVREGKPPVRPRVRDQRRSSGPGPRGRWLAGPRRQRRRCSEMASGFTSSRRPSPTASSSTPAPRTTPITRRRLTPARW